MRFINFSNHPSKAWGEEQTAAAIAYGEICDLAFPSVDAKVSEEEIQKLAEEVVAQIVKLEPAAVMCQGEFTLVFAVTTRLIALNIPVVSACSERMVTETEDGQKLVKFKFEQFRTYNKLV